ncbi:MarR family transcriptional regulator [Fibrisoma montanum]|uniref:MarR family transcriptional regulator n=1 Tax=Fibrisoma montanum TaxID=2305895 RepID=A0A418LWQ3_9BACT|nr:MarR family transcriptional regulator [Fibrisoma montanum]RIV17745.1 MarR family transcriptional regulator [Fibrisoma montanum]
MLNDVIFYVLDKTIKRYRQYAQSNIDRAGIPITVDQWLVLSVIQESPELGQTEIAERVFKDQASVARIIDLLVKKELLVQSASQQDRRRVDRAITPQGQALLQAVAPIIARNRSVALQGLSEPAIEQLRQTLETIYGNCHTTTAED